MEMSEFLKRNEEKQEKANLEDLDVQKAVVESLAADKAEQEEKITDLLKEKNLLTSKVSTLTLQNEELKEKLAAIGDVLSKNAESETSNKVALLDRDPELNDRFPGETRDHVLEVIREAFEVSEKEGRLRRAQILESVLIANEPLGNLLSKRKALEKLFSENGNILSGPVIEELQKQGISHKSGEDYLLPSEILKRMY